MSLVTCFVLKIEQFEFQMFSQHVTSTLFLSNITGSPSSIYEYCRIQYIDLVYCYKIGVICIFIKFFMKKNKKAENYEKLPGPAYKDWEKEAAR